MGLKYEIQRGGANLVCQFLQSKNYSKTRRVNAQYEGLNIEVHIFLVLATKFDIFMVFKISPSKLILKTAGWCKLSVPVFAF